MPHARIDLHRVHQPRLNEFSKAVLDGMVSGFGMPEDDLFQIFRLTMGAIADGIAALGIKRDNVLCVMLEVHGAAWYAAESKSA